ncbi:MAG: GAF domain-containing protein [Elusimicrobiota bacterium]
MNIRSQLTRYPYIYEIPTLFLALYGANRFITPEAPAFVGIEPSPLWAPILLFSLRYGTLPGAISGIIAAAFYLAGTWLSFERYLFEDLSFYALPSLFIIIAAAIGRAAQGYRTRISHLRRQQTDLEKARTLHNERMRAVQDINKELEKKISGRMTTLVTLYEGAKRLDSSDLSEIYQAILQLAAKTLNAQELAIYIKDPAGWRLHKSLGMRSFFKRPELLGDNEGIIGQAAARGKIVSLRDFVKDAAAAALPMLDCIVAGPLKRGPTGEIVAVLAIHSIPFAQFNSAMVNTLDFLLEWGSRSIERALYIIQLRDQEVLDPEFQVYSYAYYESRLAQEFLRSKTYYLPLGVCLIKLAGLGSADKQRQQRTLMALAGILKNSVRDIDIVARYPKPDIPFAVLLSTASQNQTAQIAKTIDANWNPVADKTIATLKIAVADFSPKTSCYQELLDSAEGSLKTTVS